MALPQQCHPIVIGEQRLLADRPMGQQVCINNQRGGEPRLRHAECPNQYDIKSLIWNLHCGIRTYSKTDTMVPTVSNIPIIDLEPARTGGPEDVAKVAHEVYEAFKHVGFAYIKNHGVAQDLVDEAFSWVSISTENTTPRLTCSCTW